MWNLCVGGELIVPKPLMKKIRGLDPNLVVLNEIAVYLLETKFYFSLRFH